MQTLDKAIYLTQFSKSLKQAIIDGDLASGGSGGGGGSALIWEKNSSNAPTTDYIGGMALESFDFQSTQEIYTLVTVPASYSGAKPISIKQGQFFCVTSSGKVWFKAQASLIKSDSILGFYPNVRTTTNAFVTTNGTSNTINSIGVLDITDSLGKINGVSVAAGHKILVRLYRDNVGEATPASGDAQLLINAFEIAFS